MLKLLKAFLIAVGLMKRPKPQTPTQPDIPKPEPVADVHPAPRFHGFFTRRGGVVYEREMVVLRLTESVHGCPPNEQRFGVEDNGSGPYRFELSARHVGSDRRDALYAPTGERVDGRYISVDRVIWFPLHGAATPPFPITPADTRSCKPAPPPPDNNAEPRPTSVVMLDVKIENGHGNRTHWSQRFQAVRTSCE